MNQLYETLLALLDRGRDAVLATIVAEEGSSPRGAGAQMLIGPEGLAAGTIGGGAAEGAAIELAGKLLKERRSVLRDFRLRYDPKARENPVCGGDISVLLQFIGHEDEGWRSVTAALLTRLSGKERCWLVLRTDGRTPALLDERERLLAGEAPAASCALSCSRSVLAEGFFSLPLSPGERAVIFGGGHCARALAPLLGTVGFRVTVFDDRPDFVTSERFPTAETLVLGDFLHIGETLALTGEDYVVVMTTGHQHDYEVELQVLRGPAPAYIGVIGSRTKTAYVNGRLREAGIPESAIRRVHSPIGTAIRAVTPEEIAVSIAGEMILERARLRGDGASHSCPMH